MNNTQLTRRRLLGGLGALGAVALAGCGRRGPVTSGLAVVAPQAAATPAFAVFQGQYELLVGRSQRVVFGLATVQGEPILDAGVQVRYVAENGQVGAAVQPALHEGLAAFPVYLAAIDVPAPGVGYVVVTSPDRTNGGEFAIRAVNPADSATIAPGQRAIVTRTPTTADPLGVARLCTRRINGQYAPCGMHASSLDQVLAAGRPVMLSFATPQFCASAMCGPAVDTIETVRASRDWEDLAWLHVEIFRDANGTTFLEAVQEWHLPSEPWLFAIDRTGIVVDRLEGPIIADELPPLAERLL